MEMNNLKQEAAKLRMTPAEKNAIKSQIFGVPGAATAAQPSHYFFYNFQFMQARVLVPLALVLVVFTGGSTAAAAHGSLPGDFLYPVKVSINESVEVALATTPLARAEVSQKLAERRVEEAEALAARGTLTQEVGEELAASFDAHVEVAQENTEKVEAQDPDAAGELREKLSSRLSAHGSILALLGAGSQENQEGTEAVAARVIARADREPGTALALRAAKTAAPEAQTTTMSLMVATDTDFVPQESTASEEQDPKEASLALRMQARAAQALASARARFDADKEDLNDVAITRVSGELVAIENLLEQGSTTLAAHNYTAAGEQFGEAYKRSIKLSVLLRAQAALERNVVESVLEVDDAEARLRTQVEILVPDLTR